MHKSLDIFKQYKNENIDVKFNFSKESYKKSTAEHRARKNSVYDFLLMINDFNSIVQNAVPIEIHRDRIDNGAIENMRVLASAFWNGKDIVPLK